MVPEILFRLAMMNVKFIIELIFNFQQSSKLVFLFTIDFFHLSNFIF